MPARSPLTSARKTGTPISDEPLGHDLQRHGLSGPRRAGDEPVPVGERGQEVELAARVPGDGEGVRHGESSGRGPWGILPCRRARAGPGRPPSPCPAADFPRAGAVEFGWSGGSREHPGRGPFGGAGTFKSAGIYARMFSGLEKKWAGHSPFFFAEPLSSDDEPRRTAGTHAPPDGVRARRLGNEPRGTACPDLHRQARRRGNETRASRTARAVSNQLTRLFAVENIDFDRLEVSSPGLDRPLKKAADFARFEGAEAELKLATPIDNAKKLKGVLRGCADGAVSVETAKGLITVPLAEIHRARLVPKIQWR